MKSHQFEIDQHRTAGGNVIRLRAYLHNRFGIAAPSPKGKAERSANYAKIVTGRKWPR